MDMKTRPVYMLYQTTISNPGTHTDWNWRDGKKRYSIQMKKFKKAGVATLILDKVDFKIRLLWDKKDTTLWISQINKT